MQQSGVKKIVLDSLINFFKGILVGLINVVPGFSSGTVLILCRLYEPVLDSVSGLFKSKKGFLSGLAFLAPIGIGVIIGILAFAQIIVWLLDRFALPVFALFAGLILGSVPMVIGLVYEFKNKRDKALDLQVDEPVEERLNNDNIDNIAAEPSVVIGYAELEADNKLESDASIGNKHIKLTSFKLWHLVPALVAFAIVITLSLIQRFVVDVPDAESDGLTLVSGIMIFLSGILSASSLIIPGLSGALMLILLGQYRTVADSISLSGFNIAIIAIFAVGAVVGFIVSIKLVRWLLRRFRTISYLAIIGFLIGSVAGIFILEETYYSGTGAVGIAVAVILFTAGTVGSYFLSKIGVGRSKK